MKKHLLFFFICLIFTFGIHAFPPNEKVKKTICLNMIVKNESEIIEKCLGSVKHLIDYWVIFDTGSMDGTQEIIKKFMKDIPGELHERPWVDFAHNRNEALAAAKNKGDYVLFIDADEYLEYSDHFALPNLDKDLYYITLQADTVKANRIGLVNNHLDWKWRGVLHELIESPQIKTYGFLEGVINISTSKGARSKIPSIEKHLKDSQVLEDALKKEPANSRYAFYLGQSYFLAKEFELALKSFEKRIAMKSRDVQETYSALYAIGNIHEKMDRLDSALQSYFKAYEYRPTRAESLHRIASIYRSKGNYLLGYLIAKYALTIPYPANELSCVEYTAYDYGLLVELANCCFMLKKYEEGMQACSQLLAKSNLPAEVKPTIIANYELAKRKVAEN